MEMMPLNFCRLPEEQMCQRAGDFAQDMQSRRTIRDFAASPIPEGVLESCLVAAGSAPSGANLQPWHFVIVQDPIVKKQIRVAAEEEERAFYEQRAPEEWLQALAPLGTNAEKPFLETAPALIAIFQKSTQVLEDGTEARTYYPKESVGIATGLLIAALHRAGLATLTHTPSPMRFLNEILARPTAEKPFLLLVVGFPTPDCQVPAITRKKLPEFTSWF